MTTAIFNRHEESIIRLAMAKKLINARMALQAIKTIDTMVLATTMIKKLVAKGVMSIQQGGMYAITSTFDAKLKKAILAPTGNGTTTQTWVSPVIKKAEPKVEAPKIVSLTPKQAEKAQRDSIKACKAATIKHNRQLVKDTKIKAAAKRKAEAAEKRDLDRETKRKAVLAQDRKNKSDKAKARADKAKLKAKELAEVKAEKAKIRAAKKAEKERLAMESKEAKAAAKAAKALTKPKKLTPEERDAKRQASLKAQQEKASATRTKNQQAKAAQAAEENAQKDAENLQSAKRHADVEVRIKTETKVDGRRNKKRQVFTKEMCLEIAGSFNNKTQWNAGNRPCYDAAKANGWFAECSELIRQNKIAKTKPTATPSMPAAKVEDRVKTETKVDGRRNKKRQVFTKEMCLEIAGTFNNKTDWSKSNRPCYDAAKANGWFAECSELIRQNKVAKTKAIATPAKPANTQTKAPTVSTSDNTQVDTSEAHGKTDEPKKDTMTLAMGNIKKLTNILNATAKKHVVDEVDMKRETLTQLASIMPSDVKTVLSSIADDLSK